MGRKRGKRKAVSVGRKGAKKVTRRTCKPRQRTGGVEGSEQVISGTNEAEHTAHCELESIRKKLSVKDQEKIACAGAVNQVLLADSTGTAKATAVSLAAFYQKKARVWVKNGKLVLPYEKGAKNVSRQAWLSSIDKVWVRGYTIVAADTPGAEHITRNAWRKRKDKVWVKGDKLVAPNTKGAEFITRSALQLRQKKKRKERENATAVALAALYRHKARVWVKNGKLVFPYEPGARNISRAAWQSNNRKVWVIDYTTIVAADTPGAEHITRNAWYKRKDKVWVKGNKIVAPNTKGAEFITRSALQLRLQKLKGKDGKCEIKAQPKLPKYRVWAIGEKLVAPNTEGAYVISRSAFYTRRNKIWVKDLQVVEKNTPGAQLMTKSCLYQRLRRKRLRRETETAVSLSPPQATTIGKTIAQIVANKNEGARSYKAVNSYRGKRPKSVSWHLSPESISWKCRKVCNDYGLCGTKSKGTKNNYEKHFIGKYRGKRCKKTAVSSKKIRDRDLIFWGRADSNEPVQQKNVKSESSGNFGYTSIIPGGQRQCGKRDKNRSRSSRISRKYSYEPTQQKSVKCADGANGDWTCSRCTMINPAGNLRCGACEKLRPRPSRQAQVNILKKSTLNNCQGQADSKARKLELDSLNFHSTRTPVGQYREWRNIKKSDTVSMDTHPTELREEVQGCGLKVVPTFS